MWKVQTCSHAPVTQVQVLFVSNLGAHLKVKTHTNPLTLVFFFLEVGLTELVCWKVWSSNHWTTQVWVLFGCLSSCSCYVGLFFWFNKSKIFLHLLTFTVIFTSVAHRRFNPCLFERKYSTLGEHYKEQHVYLITDPRRWESSVTCMPLDKLCY